MASRELASSQQTEAVSVPSKPPFAMVDQESPLLQFGLRQLLLFVAAICVLCAVIAAVSALSGLVLILAVLIAAMHVFATTLGGRLRARADQGHSFISGRDLQSESIASVAEREQRLDAVRHGPRSPWHFRGATSMPWLYRLIYVSVAGGGIIGTAYLAVEIGYRTSPAGVVVGGLSVAVLCGWFAFLFGSFYGVFRHGFHDAAAHDGHGNATVPRP